jgi:hypothetical protein
MTGRPVTKVKRARPHARPRARSLSQSYC